MKRTFGWIVVTFPLLFLIAFFIRSYFGNDLLFRGWSVATTIRHPTLPGETAVQVTEGNLGIASNVGTFSIFWGTYTSIYSATDKAPQSLTTFWRMRTEYPAKTYAHFAPGALGFHVVWENHPLGDVISLDEIPSPLLSASYPREFVFPYWAPIALSLLLLAVRLRRAIFTRRQTREGLCRRCGYDLRASKDCCPECGSATTSQIPAVQNP